MSDSILTTTKQPLGLPEATTAFDAELILHINSVLGTLNQLGIGPVNGFMIDDAEATWTDFLGNDARYNIVKSYMYLAVKMLFDPPDTSWVLSAQQAMLTQYEWRINRLREDILYPAPDPDVDLRDEWGDPVVLDGGDIDAP